MEAAEPFLLVDVDGDPRERGRQHGAKAAERVHRSAAIYLKALNGLGLGPVELRRLAGDFGARMAKFDAAHVEEMRGIGEGAKLPFEHVVVINARRELLGLARLKQDTIHDGCTAAVVLPEASADGVLMHGQNWDGLYENTSAAIVLRVRRSDGPDLITFTEAGQLARFGFNAVGIAITGNNLECDRDYKQIGIPLPMIRRKALETPHYALAIGVVAGTPKSGSNNMMLSHCDGEAIDLECAPDESFALHPDCGILTHANHWESVAAQSKLKDTVAIAHEALQSTPDSLYRTGRVRKFLKGKGKVTFEDFKTAFLDTFGSPYSVLRAPLPEAAAGGTICTVATILMRPGEGFMDIAALTPINPRFQRYTLTPMSLSTAA
jgi:isopenicillin-N N-acyltransferase-like protein